MYKITIDLSAWGTEDEVMTIETFDFDKIEIIKEFIEFQKDHGWAVDYDVVTEDDEEDFEDEDGDYFYDEESNTWYQYDEENDEWNEVDAEEVEEDEEDEDEEDENVEDNGGNTYIFNITPAAEDKEDAK
jgi:hypothetical protein